MLNTHSLDLERSSSQYARITDGSQTGLDITGDITIEAWVKLEQLPSTAGSLFVIAGKGDWGNSVNTRAYYLSINTDDKVFFQCSKDGGTSNRLSEIQDTASISTGEWTHIAVAVDVSANSSSIYINGNLVSSTSLVNGTISSIYNSNNDFFVGARKADGSYVNFLDGLIDEVRVWNDIRTTQEVTDNMNLELVGDEAGLVGYWKFNDNYDDETSNANDLTAVNSPVFSTDVPFVGAVSNAGFLFNFV